MNLLTSNLLRAGLGCAVVFFGALPSFAQTNPPAALESKTQSAAARDAENAKKWSVYWGWNRSNYSNSDIHFWGQGHDFTIKNAQATDMQTDLSHLFDIYLHPANITIPQTNVRVAYQYNADTAIALNLDHLKYVMTIGQVAEVVGTANGNVLSGTREINDNFVAFEHTDGLNVISLEVEKQRPIDLFGPAFPARVFALAGIGIVIPKSNVTMAVIGQTRNDEFHVAGYSAGLGAGLEIDFYKDFFFRTAYKFGYVNLPDVLTSARGDKASHQFTYNEILIAAGMRF
jgi:hypothetical protein